MSDDIDVLFEVLAEQERADTDRKHGEHILAATEGTSLGKSREERDIAILDAIGRARLAQESEDGG